MASASATRTLVLRSELDTDSKRNQPQLTGDDRWNFTRIAASPQGVVRLLWADLCDDVGASR